MTILVATPVSTWVLGDDVFPKMATLGVLAQAAATFCAMWRGWPPGKALAAAAAVLGGAWAAELLGSSTGFPFGAYRYTPLLQPQLAGVPALIPLAWFMMLAPAWAVGEAILGEARDRLGRWYAPFHAVMSGVIFAAWDLYLDPQMVERGLWAWDDSGCYFGIPWSNFLGWWLVAGLLTLLIRPKETARVRLMIIYTLTWAFQAVGLGLFWGQPGPAIVGFLGMGVFVLWAWSKERKRWMFSFGP